MSEARIFQGTLFMEKVNIAKMLTKHFINKDKVGCFHCWEKNDNHHNITGEAGIFRGTLIVWRK